MNRTIRVTMTAKEAEGLVWLAKAGYEEMVVPMASPGGRMKQAGARGSGKVQSAINRASEKEKP